MYCFLKNSFESVRFLTALPFHRKDLAHQCMSAKLECVRNTLHTPIPVTFGPFAIDKQNHCFNKHCILIDDSMKNLKQWASKVAMHGITKNLVISQGHLLGLSMSLKLQI